MTEPIREWDFSLPWGEDGEKICKKWALGFFSDNANHEVKRKTYLDEFFYVEYEQNAFNRGPWTPSGIQKNSDRYNFVIENTGIIVSIPTERLRTVTRKIYKEQPDRRKACGGENPTRGVMVSFIEMLEA